MKLSWSHAVLNVRDQDKMLDFYTNALGFAVTDRGPIADGASEIVFMSQDPDEHHQLAMVQIKQDENPVNSLNHFAFRVEFFDDLKNLHAELDTKEGINVTPLSHGNTLSIYFNDPEGNGIEVFWDTPWYVAQPQSKPWDVSLNQEEALTWVEESFQDEPGFGLREHHNDKRRAEAGS